MVYAAVDGHVHLETADPALLDAAADNLRLSSTHDPALGVLMLTEMPRLSFFDSLKRLATGCSEEDISFWHRRASQLPLLVVAGRQISTAERLEVLALGTRATLPDGEPLATVLAWCKRHGAFPVLPWGVGKWLGHRGTVVARALATCNPRNLALGDNGGRPAFWGVPAFRFAREKGVKIVPGSDPLPLAGQSRRIGCYGFDIAVDVDERTPARAILDALREPATNIEPFGAPRPLHRFLAEQAAMRLPRPIAHALS